MQFKKNIVIYSVIIGLAVFGALGWSMALKSGSQVNAQSDTPVDGETLDELYEAVFHRPADSAGKNFHLGRGLKAVLKDFSNSDEARYYGALFKAVKSYEESQRTPGNLSSSEKQSHLDLIDSALSNLLAWVATLPDQEACRATVGPERAREAIKQAYERLSEAGKTDAEHGLLNALNRIGPPGGIVIHPKCLRPSVTPSASSSVTPSPDGDEDDEEEEEDEDDEEASPSPSVSPSASPAT